MSGGAGGGSPAPASPAARSGLGPRPAQPLGRSVQMPDAGSDAHEHARWQSVQWLGRDGRGCSGPRRAPECAGARLPSGSGAGGGPCPQRTCPGIGRMRRSNPRPDRRPTVVVAAVQPRVRALHRFRAQTCWAFLTPAALPMRRCPSAQSKNLIRHTPCFTCRRSAPSRRALATRTDGLN